MDKTVIADVATPVAAPHPFTYWAPPGVAEKLRVGSRVMVPLGSRRVDGYVVRIAFADTIERLKPILEIMDEIPLFPPSMVPFFEWVADYYIHPLGMVLKAALPAGLNLKSEAVYELTGPADSAPSDVPGSDAEKEAFRALRADGFLPRGWKGDGLSGAQSAEALASLVSRGYARISARIRDRGVRPREMKTVTRLPMTDLELVSLAPRQREVVEYLDEGEPVPLAEVAKAVPGAASAVQSLAKKRLVKIGKNRFYRTPVGSEIIADAVSLRLTSDQQRAVDDIASAMNSGEYRPYLLHGVTGSGKTEVYARAVELALSQGKSALILVPEITLSLSMEGIFRARFGDDVAIIHSGISKGEAYDQWIRIASGSARVVLGARSAIFAPLDRPGVIIVDEEHDHSYKQEDRLRYNARDLALLRARMARCVAVLGSATPSLRTYKNAVSGKIGYLGLPARVHGRPLPAIDIVDMRQETGTGYFSAQLIGAIRENLERGDQSLLFLNRRGYSPVIMCARCGESVSCPHCSISLTYHKGSDKLVCHYCDHQRPLPEKCPTCGSSALMKLGLGTERLQKEMETLFPEARIARLDSDTLPKRNELLQLLKELRKGDIDILLGTQMVAKGHDFPNVTLVGVISADQSLRFPDYMAAERTFQLLAQVSGRAGRAAKQGRVIIQTYDPGHYSIIKARGHNFHPFYLDEIIRRREFRYPPFSRLIVFAVTGKDNRQTAEVAEVVAREARAALDSAGVWGRVLGPAPAVVARVKGKYRWRVLLMGASPKALNAIAKTALEKSAPQKSRGVTVAVDVDPNTIL